MIEKDLADSRKEAGEYCAIRNSEGALIGVIDIILKALEPSASYLMLLMIGKPWRNRGYGRMVMVALEEYLCEQYGSKQLDAEVQTSNPKGTRRRVSSPIAEPASETLPLLGRVTPASIRKSVLLPQSFSPRMPNTRPWSAVSEMPRNAQVPGYRFHRS